MSVSNTNQQTSPLHHIVPLCRNSDYLLLWYGQASSFICSQLSQFPLPLFALALTGSLSILQLCLVSLLEGTCFVFFNVAEVACLPRVVAKEQLKAAASLHETTDNISYTLGPFLGGILFGIGRALPFLFDAVSYIISVVSLFFIKKEFQEQRTEPTRNVWAEIHEGLLWLWRHPVLRFVAFLSFMGMFMDFGTVLLVIVIATKLHASPVAIALIYALPAIVRFF